MTDPLPSPAAPEPRRRFTARRAGLAAALVALPLAAGATGFTLARSTPTVIPATPTPIAQLAPDTAAAVKGRVAEIYGNKAVIQDDTGRALADFGRAGDDTALVSVGDTVTVQGRFDRGVLKANALIRGDGALVALQSGPPKGPRGGPGRDPAEWARDRLGVADRVDVPAVEASLAGAGFTEIRVVGSGPKHLEVTAKDPSGRAQRLHVGFDGRIRKTTPLG